MTDKPFHTTQSDTLLSGIHFSPEFSDLRIRGKKKWVINEKCKKALEDSIKRGIAVVNNGNFNCSNYEK